MAGLFGLVLATSGFLAVVVVTTGLLTWLVIVLPVVVPELTLLVALGLLELAGLVWLLVASGLAVFAVLAFVVTFKVGFCGLLLLATTGALSFKVCPSARSSDLRSLSLRRASMLKPYCLAILLKLSPF